jgi:hypothetical protein
LITTPNSINHLIGLIGKLLGIIQMWFEAMNNPKRQETQEVLIFSKVPDKLSTVSDDKILVQGPMFMHMVRTIEELDKRSYGKRVQRKESELESISTTPNKPKADSKRIDMPKTKPKRRRSKGKHQHGTTCREKKETTPLQSI